MRPLDLIDVDTLHTAEELAVRAAVARAVDELIRPYIAGWYARGALPVRELTRQFAAIGLFGRYLLGPDGAGAVGYGLSCLELESGDSGVRSLVSVHG
jgi:glutaryl-CoA dehydrogenase